MTAAGQPYKSLADIRIERAEAAGDTATADYWRQVKADVDKAPPLGPRQKALIRACLAPQAPARESA